MRFGGDGGVITLAKMKSGGWRGVSAEAEPSGKLTLVAKKCLRESHSRGCDSGRALVSLGTSFFGLPISCLLFSAESPRREFQ